MIFKKGRINRKSSAPHHASVPPAQAPAAATTGAPTGATIVQGTDSWWKTKFDNWRSETPWGLIVLAFMGVLAYIYSKPGAEFAGYPAWLIIIALLLVLVVFGGTIKTRAVENQEIAVVAAFVILLFILGYALYPEMRSTMETPGALGFLLLVVIAYSFFVIIKKVFWKESKATAIIMILVLVAILEPGVVRQLPASVKANFHNLFSGVSVAKKTCAEVRPTAGYPDPLGPDWEPLPAHCDIGFTVVTGAILLKPKNPSEPLRRIGVGDPVPDIRTSGYVAVKADGSRALWYHMECNRKTRNWTCVSS